MKRYSFGTFEVDDANRQAYETCRAAADLEHVAPLPILLVGSEASGKTHLLYSVVNRVRAGAAKTGLAYVTARDFPEQVRALIDDPTPVERAQSAILLVDQLEQFDDYSRELENVVRVFLDNGHCVILASRVRPEALTNLTGGLRKMLDTGQVVEILAGPRQVEETAVSPVQPAERGSWALSDVNNVPPVRFRPETTPAASTAERREEAPTASETGETETEVRALREAKAAAEREASELRYQVAALEAEWRTAQGKAARFKASLDETLAEKAAVESEITELRLQVSELEAEWRAAQNRSSNLEATLADKAAVALNMEDLREQLAVLQAENESLAGKSGRFDALVAEKTSLQTRVEGLQGELAEARRESAVARQEANQLVQRAETLLAQVESNRIQLVEAKQEHQEEVRNLQALIEEQNRNRIAAEEFVEANARRDTAQAEAEALRRELAEAREQFSEEKESLETELVSTKSELTGVLEERDGVVAHQEELDAWLHRLQGEFQTTVEARDLALAQQRQLAAARDEAEGRLDELTQQLGSLRSACDAAEAKVPALMEEIVGVRTERDEHKAALEEVSAERTALDAVIAQFRDDLEAQTREISVTRQEAGNQIAKWKAQAERMQKRLDEVYAAFDLTRQTNLVVGLGLDSIRQQLQETGEAVQKLAKRLSAAGEVSAAEARKKTEADGPASGDETPADAAQPDAASLLDELDALSSDEFGASVEGNLPGEGGG
jgi:chromosome segregation ATPase